MTHCLASSAKGHEMLVLHLQGDVGFQGVRQLGAQADQLRGVHCVPPNHGGATVVGRAHVGLRLDIRGRPLRACVLRTCDGSEVDP